MLKAYVIKITEQVKLFYDKDGIGYGKIVKDDRVEVMRLYGSAFESEIRKIIFKKKGIALGSGTVKEIASHCMALAQDGPKKKVNNRYALNGNIVRVDPMEPDSNKIVRIDKEGWRVVKSMALFHRQATQKALPIPRNGKGAKKFRGLFRNIPINDFKLMLAWMVCVIHSKGPFPILVIQGEQGSAKTFLVEIIRDLLDPVKGGLLSLPGSERNLVIMAANNVILAFDNVSSLKNWLPDALCRISTGTGFSCRKLYSNDEMMVIETCRPIILNGITDFVSKNDLADRSLLITMGRIDPKKRKSKAFLWEQYQEAKPEILGFLYGAVATALKYKDSVELEETPRMADFAILACAAVPSLKWNKEKFLKAYEKNRSQLMEVCYDSDAIARSVYEFILEKEDYTGTATELLTELRSFNDGNDQNKYFPSNPSKLSSRLKEAVPALRDKGVEVAFRRTSGARLIDIKLSNT